MTLTSGLAFSKSSTTDWMTSASRSVKKCQNDTVPLRVVRRRGLDGLIGGSASGASGEGERRRGGERCQCTDLAHDGMVFQRNTSLFLRLLLDGVLRYSLVQFVEQVLSYLVYEDLACPAQDGVLGDE